jgi:hypothetical protein
VVAGCLRLLQALGAAGDDDSSAVRHLVSGALTMRRAIEGLINSKNINIL